MYKIPNYQKSKIKSVELIEGKSIEQKIESITENKEPIKDGAPLIYTERKNGVIAAYNIRTDRWEIACEAMSSVEKSFQAKRDERANMQVVKEDKVDKVESIQGKIIDNNQ